MNRCECGTEACHGNYCVDCWNEREHSSAFDLKHEERMAIRDEIKNSWSDKTERERRTGYSRAWNGTHWEDYTWWPLPCPVVTDKRKFLPEDEPDNEDYWQDGL